jgi:hypothetical protein
MDDFRVTESTHPVLTNKRIFLGKLYTFDELGRFSFGLAYVW